MTDTDLEALFDAALVDAPTVPDALMARVIADANSMQPKRSFWSSLMDALGGLPALGGLVTATCVGVWLGVAPPSDLPDLAGQVMGFEMAYEDELDSFDMTGFDWELEEG